jgi:diaminohydroxyphosphoribosylaminopyrimidine deaminase/5-amino-6-(5-phosphoribosylamino)uracil reductase
MLIDQLVDRIVVYVGALLAGGAGLAPFGGAFRTIADAKGLVITDVTRLGPDLRIDAELEAS